MDISAFRTVETQARRCSLLLSLPGTHRMLSRRLSAWCLWRLTYQAFPRRADDCYSCSKVETHDDANPGNENEWNGRDQEEQENSDECESNKIIS